MASGPLPSKSFPDTSASVHTHNFRYPLSYRTMRSLTILAVARSAAQDPSCRPWCESSRVESDNLMFAGSWRQTTAEENAAPPCCGWDGSDWRREAACQTRGESTFQRNATQWRVGAIGRPRLPVCAEGILHVGCADLVPPSGVGCPGILRRPRPCENQSFEAAPFLRPVAMCFNEAFSTRVEGREAKRICLVQERAERSRRGRVRAI